MDIYSAARRLGRPFHCSPADRPCSLPIGARGIVGDGHTCALVRVDGVIDWMCFPRFDSPSVFGALLDTERGGFTAIQPLRPFESLQQYDPDTNVLETLFRVEGEGVVRITDFMPWQDDPRASVLELHRRIECMEGQVSLRAVFDPRFDYGASVPSWEKHPEGMTACGPQSARLCAVLSNDCTWRERAIGGFESEFRIRSGERRWLILDWGTERPDRLDGYRPFERLRSTRREWRNWTRKITYDGPWRHHVVRSALCLKLLIHAPFGSMVAAPTTSLPEWIGGARNWDYRYTWVRDTAMAIRAANRIGCRSEAREFFHFVRDHVRAGQDPQIMHAVDGCPVPDEVILQHLSGFRGSMPVRIGNGAREQTQSDTPGALVNAAFLYEKYGDALSLDVWRRLRDIVESVRLGWSSPDQGIWEPRVGVRHNVHSKLMSWVALDRGAHLAARFGDPVRQSSWRRAAAEVQHDLLQHGTDPSGRHFVNAYGECQPDAALLLVPIHGMLAANDPRVIGTVRWLRSELHDGLFLRRYRLDDGVEGREGAFLLCGFWLAEALTMAGELTAAQDVFNAHCQAANHVGLLAEEIDVASGVLLGNFPQAFSHLGLINAAVRIDRALQATRDP